MFKNNASWYDIAEDYSERSLTKQSDRLVALSGIARATQKFYPGATYVGGMWSALLPSSLLWRNAWRKDPEPAQPGTDHFEYIAPSWSWASVRCTITFDDCYPRSADDHLTQNLKIEKMVGIPKHKDQYGALEYAALVLSGALLLEVDIGPATESKYCLDMSWDGKLVGIVIVDEPDTFDLHRKFKLFLLPIVTHHSRIYGIVIREEGNPSGDYSRVGQGYISCFWGHKVSFSGCKPCTVQLI